MKSRLKLALVTRRYPPLIGGAEKVFSYLAAALAAHGADVTVLTSQVPTPRGARNTSHLAEAVDCPPSVQTGTAQLHVERLVTSRLRFWGTWLYMRNLARWLTANATDLAYVSMLKHDAYTVLGVAKRVGFPVVLRPEGAGATGDVAWQSWGNFGRVIGHRCRRADAFVAVSHAIEMELHEAWKCGTMRPSVLDSRPGSQPMEPRILAIPNGVPVPAVPWQPTQHLTASLHVVFVGRLSAEKGLDTLVNAWSLVRAMFSDARLIMVGEGPERSNLEAKVKEQQLPLGPGGAVELPGASLDVTEWMRRADLFVLPSREEGMSIALLEAMALGIPIVATSIPGNSRLIHDGEHGRLVPPNDSGRLAQVIAEQWSNPNGAIRMSHAARARVKAEFSIDIVARQHLDLFERILERRKQRS